MKSSELRAALAAMEAEHGDVELPDEALLALVPQRVVLTRETAPSFRRIYLNDVVQSEPPFAPELQQADPRETGEPDHFGPVIVDGMHSTRGLGQVWPPSSASRPSGAGGIQPRGGA